MPTLFTRVAALYGRETLRFRKLWLDTLVSPIVSAFLYLLVFGAINGGRAVEGIPYNAFVYGGLMTMLLTNASFSNPSFALVISKNTGTIVDLYLAPIRASFIGLAYAAAAVTRAVLTLLAALLLTGWFIDGLTFVHPLWLVLGILLTSSTFAFIGITFGASTKGFESMTFATSFVLQPMIFLSGAFYSIATLPAPWSTISTFNPLHHFVNLLRYGFTGYSDISPLTSLGITLGFAAITGIIMAVVITKTLRSE
jgi:ABC-2 type transport system permease protein